MVSAPPESATLITGEKMSKAEFLCRWEALPEVKLAELIEGVVFVPSPVSSGSGLTPDGLRMLQAIETLPEEERETFDLVRIQGLTQADAAEILGVTIRTVRRRLNRSVLLLTQQLDDLRPSGEPPSP